MCFGFENQKLIVRDISVCLQGSALVHVSTFTLRKQKKKMEKKNGKVRDKNSKVKEGKKSISGLHANTKDPDR